MVALWFSLVVSSYWTSNQIVWRLISKSSLDSSCDYRSLRLNETKWGKPIWGQDIFSGQFLAANLAVPSFVSFCCLHCAIAKILRVVDSNICNHNIKPWRIPGAEYSREFKDVHVRGVWIQALICLFSVQCCLWNITCFLVSFNEHMN